MLRQVLKTFSEAPGPTSLDLLAAQLDVERATLAGMLDELVRMGRLARIDDRAGMAGCVACGIKGRCPYLLTTSGAYYALPEMVASSAPCQPARGT